MLALLCLITGVSLRNYPSGINIFFKYNRASFMQYVTLAQVVKNALYFYILYIWDIISQMEAIIALFYFEKPTSMDVGYTWM